MKFSKRKALSSLQLKENGLSVAEVCKKQKISRATFYNWMTVLRIEALEKENKSLKRELLRLKPKKKKRIILSEYNSADNNSNEEYFDTIASVIADIILSSDNNNLKEFSKQTQNVKG